MCALRNITKLISLLLFFVITDVSNAAVILSNNTLSPTYTITADSLLGPDTIVTPNNFTLEEGGVLSLNFESIDTYNYLYFEYGDTGLSDGDVLGLYQNEALIWETEIRLDPIEGNPTAGGHERGGIYIDLSLYTGGASQLTFYFGGDGLNGGVYNLSNFDLRNEISASVPESGTMILLLSGLLFMGRITRRRHSI